MMMKEVSNMKKEFYNVPEMELVLFQNADVIRTSEIFDEDEFEG